jgi:hypothetical protein
MKAINLNDLVLVRLTTKGEWAWKKFYIDLGVNPPILETEFHYGRDGGLFRIQLWHLMEVFGPHIHLGGEPLFDTQILLPTEPTDV